MPFGQFEQNFNFWYVSLDWEVLLRFCTQILQCFTSCKCFHIWFSWKLDGHISARFLSRVRKVELSSLQAVVTAIYLSPIQGANSIKICRLCSIGNPIVEIRWSFDRLVSTMEIPISVRRHYYIESEPSMCVLIVEHCKFNVWLHRNFLAYLVTILWDF